MLPVWLDRQSYPFASRWMSLPEGTLHYVDEGAGLPLVLVHGTPTWSFEFRHLISALSSRFRCIAPDHLGFGLSERPPDADYGPSGHARRFEKLLERLSLGRYVLVVHDFGGPIALPAALAHPERLAAVVVMNSWMWSFEDDGAMARRARLAAGWVGRFAYRQLNSSLRLLMPSAYGDRTQLTPAIHQQYLACFPDADSRGKVLWPLARALLGESGLYQSLWERRACLSRTPVLLLWGMKDPALPPRNLDRWRVAVPHARVVRLGWVGHWPHEEAPEVVSAELEAFLEGLGGEADVERSERGGAAVLGGAQEGSR